MSGVMYGLEFKQQTPHTHTHTHTGFSKALSAVAGSERAALELGGVCRITQIYQNIQLLGKDFQNIITKYYDLKYRTTMIY